MLYALSCKIIKLIMPQKKGKLTKNNRRLSNIFTGRMPEEFTTAFQQIFTSDIKFQAVLSSFFYKLNKIILNYMYIALN
jgi:hypothetical protein